jgi:hypothetical protein
MTDRNARDDALEEAAQVAEKTPAYGDSLHRVNGMPTTGERIAAAIRALKGAGATALAEKINKEKNP